MENVVYDHASRGKHPISGYPVGKVYDVSAFEKVRSNYAKNSSGKFWGEPSSIDVHALIPGVPAFTWRLEPDAPDELKDEKTVFTTFNCQKIPKHINTHDELLDSLHYQGFAIITQEAFLQQNKKVDMNVDGIIDYVNTDVNRDRWKSGDLLKLSFPEFNRSLGKKVLPTTEGYTGGEAKKEKKTSYDMDPERIEYAIKSVKMTTGDRVQFDKYKRITAYLTKATIDSVPLELQYALEEGMEKDLQKKVYASFINAVEKLQGYASKGTTEPKKTVVEGLEKKEEKEEEEGENKKEIISLTEEKEKTVEKSVIKKKESEKPQKRKRITKDDELGRKRFCDELKNDEEKAKSFKDVFNDFSIMHNCHNKRIVAVVIQGAPFGYPCRVKLLRPLYL